MPGELGVVTVEGDPMEPVASSRQRILIDVSRRVPVASGIFVIWDGLWLVTKRLKHMPHSDPPWVMLKSSNPDYDWYERLGAEELRIVGRAV